MNRPIKFRAWDREGEIMLYEGDYAPFEGCDSNFVGASSRGALFQERCEEVSDKTVECDDENYALMQFTGLTDKNGKEIYEGDWLRLVPENMVGEVCFRDGSFVLGREGRGWNFSSVAKMPDTYEVIGNIYENPELLTDKGV